MAGSDPKAEGASEAYETGELDSIEALEAAGDVEGLLEAARAYRTGKGVPRDFGACFRAYDAAARLGSAEGSYSSAQFFLRGGVVSIDPKEALARLRTAADGGSIPAKVCLANMYEAGVYVRADREKGDVWIRTIARSADVRAAPGTPEYTQAMAELGVARFALEVAETHPKQGEALLKKAAAFGWRDPAAAANEERPTVTPPRPTPQLDIVEKREMLDAELEIDDPIDSEERAHALRKRGAAAPVKAHAGIAWRSGLSKFVFAVMFAGAAIAAGHLLTEGATLLVARGQPVPLVGPHVERIWPIALAAVAGIPALLLYGFAQVLRALVVAALAGVLGALSWGHPHLTLATSSATQGMAFALAGFLAGLLVFGLVTPDKKSR